MNTKAALIVAGGLVIAGGCLVTAAIILVIGLGGFSLRTGGAEPPRESRAHDDPRERPAGDLVTLQDLQTGRWVIKPYDQAGLYFRFDPNGTLYYPDALGEQRWGTYEYRGNDLTVNADNKIGGFHGRLTWQERPNRILFTDATGVSEWIRDR
jgi:hypothetical protein